MSIPRSLSRFLHSLCRQLVLQFFNQLIYFFQFSLFLLQFQILFQELERFFKLILLGNLFDHQVSVLCKRYTTCRAPFVSFEFRILVPSDSLQLTVLIGYAAPRAQSDTRFQKHAKLLTMLLAVV